MGAGKGYALQWMSNQGFFPLGSIVHIDPDAFKALMSEWPAYVSHAPAWWSIVVLWQDCVAC